MSSDCLNTQCCLTDFFRIANAAVDEYPAPSVGNTKHRQISTNQRAAQGTTSINHEHSTIACFFEQGSDHGVVLEYLHRNYWAIKEIQAAEIVKQQIGDQGLRVSIGKIGG